MQRLLFLIVLFTTLLSSGAFAQHSDGFAGIPFGITREQVIEEVMKMGYEPFGQTVGYERIGDQNSSRSVSDHIVIPVYKFGDLPVQVDFVFNKDDRFYSFQIRTGRVERSRLAKAFDAAAYMSEQFTLKYGKASGAPEVDENSVLKEGFFPANIYQKWYAIKALNVDIRMVNIDGRYFVIGTVIHRKLAETAEKKKDRGRKRSEKQSEARPVF